MQAALKLLARQPRDAGRLCRVTIDIDQVQANLSAQSAGEAVSMEDVFDWLETIGFTPSPDGAAWLAPQRALRHLDESEILSRE